MKKKIEIEVEIPDDKEILLWEYLSQVDDRTYGYILGIMAGNLYSNGLITFEESSEFLDKFKRG